ncbi:MULTISPECIES: acyl carrier protein [unclassified Streptomyces]|uniref:acyl carrier protein n=1 Tax=unclassified Streptomyces TaxID=2593676 RepID=UPI0022B6DD2C|nr:MULTISPECIES: acyl carrier protein [unclassified Streptomyces]MCZ7416010.1 acyl carrier protein [Streptomyces sp. WMMC897]MCZ7434183.1 acyl carrier protein [Streptomyces sp. WMMC1477]
MNENEIRAAVSEVIADVLTLPRDGVTPQAHFYDDLGGDSMQKLEVIAHLEARFNIRFTDEEAAAGDTVEALSLQVVRHAS